MMQQQIALARKPHIVVSTPVRAHKPSFSVTTKTLQSVMALQSWANSLHS